MKQIILRYPAACARCGKRLNRGTIAWWKPSHVECSACYSGLSHTKEDAKPMIAMPQPVAPRRTPMVALFSYQKSNYKRTSRDAQRKKCYAWEIEHLQRAPGHRPLSLSECQALSDKALALFGKPSIPVEGSRRNRGDCNSRRIRLPRFAQTNTYVLHETAHAIAWDGPDWHGPHFVRVLLFLLDYFGVVPSVKELETKASAAGLKVAPEEVVIKKAA